MHRTLATTQNGEQKSEETEWWTGGHTHRHQSGCQHVSAYNRNGSRRQQTHTQYARVQRGVCMEIYGVVGCKIIILVIAISHAVCHVATHKWPMRTNSSSPHRCNLHFECCGEQVNSLLLPLFGGCALSTRFVAFLCECNGRRLNGSHLCCLCCELNLVFYCFYYCAFECFDFVFFFSVLFCPSLLLLLPLLPSLSTVIDRLIVAMVAVSSFAQFD